MKDVTEKITAANVLAIVFMGLIFGISPVSIHQNIMDIKQKAYFIYQDMLIPYLSSKNTYINLHGLIARAMGQRVMNNVVKLDNGHLVTLTDKISQNSYAEILKNFKNFCGERNIHFLFVQAPVSICKYDKQLPVGIEDYENENMDELLTHLQNTPVETLDLREELHKDGMDHYEAFFKTDHHWKYTTAFWANGKILNYLSEKGIIETAPPELISLENYTIETYKDWFLGSRGKRTGTYFGGIGLSIKPIKYVDDFMVITPNFDTNIVFTIKSDTPIVREGAFVDSVLDIPYLLQKDYFNRGPYEGVNRNNNIEVEFRNEAAPIKKRILFFSDSFNTPMRGFTALCVESLYSVYLAGFNGDIKTLIEDYNPDIIVVTGTYSSMIDKIKL